MILLSRSLPLLLLTFSASSLVACGQVAAAKQPVSKSASAPPMADSPWWKHTVIYEIYPRNFQDSNGDGIGDLNEAAEPSSLPNWDKKLIGLRRSVPALHDGGVVMIDQQNPDVLSCVRKHPADAGRGMQHALVQQHSPSWRAEDASPRYSRSRTA